MVTNALSPSQRHEDRCSPPRPRQMPARGSPDSPIRPEKQTYIFDAETSDF